MLLLMNMNFLTKLKLKDLRCDFCHYSSTNCALRMPILLYTIRLEIILNVLIKNTAS